MTSYSGKFNGQFFDSFLFTQKIKIKLFWVIMHSDTGLYIKEVNHNNAKKGCNFMCNFMSVVREKIAPEAIQFHGLRRRHGGLYGSRTHGNSQRRQVGTHFLRIRIRNAYALMETGLNICYVNLEVQ